MNIKLLFLSLAILGVLLLAGCSDEPAVKRTTELDKDGNRAAQTVYTYENGQLIKTSYYDGMGNLEKYITVEYEDGLAVRHNEFSTTDQIGYSISDYDDKEQKIKLSNFFRDHTLLNYTTWSYNARGLIDNSTKYNSNHNVTGIWSDHQYDTHGALLSMNRKDPQGRVIVAYKYHYDEHGNEIKEEWFRPGGELAVYWSREYDERNLKIKETQFDLAGRALKTIYYEY